MSNEENLKLVTLIRNGDKNAENELIKKNIGLVHGVMRHYRILPGEYEDLFQMGCIGLLKAARAFDQTKTNAFSTYAVCLIAGEIKRFIRDNTAVKISRNLREIHMRVTRVTPILTGRLGREPTISEISEETGDSVEDIIMAEEANESVLSLEYTIDEDGSSLSDTIGTDPTNDFNDKIALKVAIDKLEAFDRKIIMLRFYKNKTQCETAKMLGVTQVQISRRERVIIKELRLLMEA